MTTENRLPGEAVAQWLFGTATLWAFGYALISFVAWEWADAWHPLSRLWLVFSGFVNLAAIIGDGGASEPQEDNRNG